MQNAPSIKELVEAARLFLEERAMPELKGHTAFHARVAANALGIIERELELGPKATEEEKARLVALLRSEGSLDELNRQLADAIRTGEMSLATPGLKDHLWRTTIDKVSIDQPGYSGLKSATEQSD